MARRPTPSPEKVGPGNPPRSTQFQKGKSGNPGGRPRKERDFVKLVDSELDEIVTGSENGKTVKLTKRQVIAKRLVADAAKGDMKAIDRVISLVSRIATDGNKLIGLDPAVLATFLKRYGGDSGEGGAAA